MDTIREGKVAVVEAVRARLDDADGAVVTEYRGLTVAEMASLRRALRAVGGDYKVFKNTLVRRAVEGSAHAPLTDLLEGPTAIAFVRGDVSAVAKALRDFARAAPSLVVKGGVLDGALLDAAELGALADLPSRDVLLAMFAGALAAPMRSMAGLLVALPQGLAYGLSALLESRGGTPVTAEAPAADEAPAAVETADAADAPEGSGAEGTDGSAEAPAAEAAVDGAAAPADAPPAEGAAEAAPEESAADTVAPAGEDAAVGEDAAAAPSEDETAGA
ncbi:MAG TPA: 50S ribosomal protein L10 [Acidimicrobiales bacterium]|jgi:large subunit ribosomal protein L10|nr:50S ribosomal protein L10 [Acidimicrobiales bacterium]